MKESEITSEMMSSLLSYDAETGFLTWKERPIEYYENPLHQKRWNTFYADQRAGTLSKHGYVILKVFGKNRYAHRIAWLLATGKWPVKKVDHENGIRSHNWIKNLREATDLQNQKNRKQNKNATSGFRGVYWNKREGRYRAHIKDSNKNIHLGYFDTFEAAVDARIAGEKKYGYHENHGRITLVKGAI